MEETTDVPMKSKGQNVWLGRACGLVTLLCVFIPAVFWKGGVLEGESTYFIINYGDARTLPQKIFNPLANDFNMYQARELSYVFDYLNAQFFLFLLKRFDVTFFVPLFAVVSTILIIFIFRRGVRKTLPGLDRLTTELLLLPFLTCFVMVSTMGMYYRSAKPMLAPVLLALLFQVLRTAQRRAAGLLVERRWTLVTPQSLITFFLLVVAALLDRQGFFYVLSACALLLVHCGLTGRLKDLLIASFAAAAFAHVYNLWLGPAIILAVNGQPPDFTFQQIPAEAWANLPLNCLQAGRLLIANLATLAGGYLVVGYVVLGLATAGLLWRTLVFYGIAEPGRRWEHFKSSQSLAILYALIIIALHVVMFGVMIARHPYVYTWIDHWYWYYPLPFLVVALFGLAVFLNATLPEWQTVSRRLLRVALILIAASNLAHLPAYRSLMATGEWFGPIYTMTENLKASIRHRYPHPDLSGDFEQFFLFHQEVRKSAKSGDR